MVLLGLTPIDTKAGALIPLIIVIELEERVGVAQIEEYVKSQVITSAMVIELSV